MPWSQSYGRAAANTAEQLGQPAPAVAWAGLPAMHWQS
jgi:hypothetical protein